MKPKVISLFTGAGGLDLGFETCGAETVFASDILEPACDTLKLNRPNMFVYGPPEYSGDVNDLTWDFIKKGTGLKKGETDIFIGGPPCQPFSAAAMQRFLKSDARYKRKGFTCNEKGNLVFRFVELVLDIKPKVFLIENVPGLLSIDGGESIKRIIKTFSSNGYTVSEPFVLNAEKYGVPQRRRRAFIIGYHGKKKIKKPSPTHGKTPDLILKEFCTVAQALHKFSRDLDNAETRDHKPDSLKRYKKLEFGQREKKGRVDRLDPNLPSKTVIAGGSNGGGRSHLHSYQARTLSVRECARLQTFPDDYIFAGSSARQFTQVGNAVPPLLGEILARSMLKEFFGITIRKPLTFSVRDVDREKADRALLAWAVKDNKKLLYNNVDIDGGISRTSLGWP